MQVGELQIILDELNVQSYRVSDKLTFLATFSDVLESTNSECTSESEYTTGLEYYVTAYKYTYLLL